MVAEAVKERMDFEAIEKALGLVDAGLASTQHREMLSAGEVADTLLDIRTLLAPLATPVLKDPEPIPAN